MNPSIYRVHPMRNEEEQTMPSFDLAVYGVIARNSQPVLGSMVARFLMTDQKVESIACALAALPNDVRDAVHKLDKDGLVELMGEDQR